MSSAASKGGSKKPSDSKPSANTKRPHRVLTWVAVVVASLLALTGVLANWIQDEALDTNQWKKTTETVVQDQDVQTALSTYLVDQLYANVDVNQKLKQALPPQAAPVSGEISALLQQVAQQLASKLLASPRVQTLIVNASTEAHGQLVDLLENKDKYISTNNGEVTLDLSGVIANLAEQLGVPAAAVNKVQSFIHTEVSQLNTKLAQAQSNLTTLNQGLADYQQGNLSASTAKQLVTAQAKVAAASTALDGLAKKLPTVEQKVPSQMQGLVKQLSQVVVALDNGLTQLNDQMKAVEQNPNQANVTALRGSITKIQARITKLQNRPLLKQPGQLVLVRSSDLELAQTGTSILRGLGFVLPLLAILIYLLALYLARGYRREVLVRIGAAVVITGAVLLVIANWAGDEMVNTLPKTKSGEAAVRSIWDTLSGSLTDRIWFAIVTGVLLILAGVLAGPSQVATNLRRWMAPALRDQIAWVYAGIAVLFLLRLALMPSPSGNQLLPQLILAVLIVIGVEALRKQTAKEFPPAT